MWSLVWPIVLVIAANTCYNICAKSTPADIQPFASLTLTYLVAAAAAFALFLCAGPQRNFLLEVRKANWAPFVLGAAIVALEFGYIHVYRAGWKVSLGSLVANAGLACVLLAVGVLFYREAVSLRQVAGLGCVLLGLVLLGK